GGGCCMCGIAQQSSQFAHEPGRTVCSAEGQYAADAQARGACGVVGLVESNGSQQLRTAGPEREGQGADPGLMNDGACAREDAGIGQVAESGHAGWQSLLERHAGQEQPTKTESLTGSDGVLPVVRSEPDGGGSQRKDHGWRPRGEKPLEVLVGRCGRVLRIGRIV